MFDIKRFSSCIFDYYFGIISKFETPITHLANLRDKKLTEKFNKKE